MCIRDRTTTLYSSFIQSLIQGDQYFEQKNWKEAYKSFNIVLKLAKEAENQELIKTLNFNISNLLHYGLSEGKENLKQGNWEKARNCFYTVLQLANDNGDKQIILKSKLSLYNLELEEGNFLFKQKKWVQARDCFNSALKQAEALDDRRLISEVGIKLASVDLALTNEAYEVNHENEDENNEDENIEDKVNSETASESKIEPENVVASSISATAATNGNSQNMIFTALSMPITPPSDSKPQATVNYEKDLTDINSKISALQNTIEPKNPSFILPNTASGLGTIATVAGAALLLTNPIGWAILAGGAVIAAVGLIVSVVRLNEYIKRQDQLETLERLQKNKQQIIAAKTSNVSSEPTAQRQISPPHINNGPSYIPPNPSSPRSTEYPAQTGGRRRR